MVFPLKKLFIIARFELVRLFLTTRGCISLLAFALLWSVLLRYLIYNASYYLLDRDTSNLIGALIGNTDVQNPLAWPVAEMSVFWGVALYLFPFFCIVLTADQTASDRSRGTLRLINLRANRDTIYFGRFLGQMIIQGLLIIATVGSVLVLAVSRDTSLLGAGLSLAVLITVNLVIVLLPYTALMALVSVIAKSARQATVYAIILWLILLILIAWLAPYFPDVGFFQWILPGSQFSALLEKEGWDMLSLAHIPLIQTVVLLGVGRWLMQRSDL